MCSFKNVKNGVNRLGPEFPHEIIIASFKANCCWTWPFKPCRKINGPTVLFSVFYSKCIEGLSSRKESQRGGSYAHGADECGIDLFIKRRSGA